MLTLKGALFPMKNSGICGKLKLEHYKMIDLTSFKFPWVSLPERRIMDSKMASTSLKEKDSTYVAPCKRYNLSWTSNSSGVEPVDPVNLNNNLTARYVRFTLI